MEPKHDDRPVELSLYLVLNVLRTHQHAAEVARKARPFPTPHTKGCGATQGGNVPPRTHCFASTPHVRKRYVTSPTMRRDRNRSKGPRRRPNSLPAAA
jgi:hypothetical protein